MTHLGSGNPTWQDWPSTATLVAAESLERLETAVDRATPGAWAPLTMQNGWAARNSVQGQSPLYYAPACRLLPGDRVELNGTVFKTAGGANSEQITTLPVGYRPARECAIPIMDSSGQPLGLYARPDGTVILFSNRTSAASLYLYGTFPLTALT